jgi:hypothetical protein
MDNTLNATQRAAVKKSLEHSLFLAEQGLAQKIKHGRSAVVIALAEQYIATLKTQIASVRA